MNVKVDSYSGFGDATGGGLEKTELEEVLREGGVTDVFVGGIAWDVCVAFTCKDAVRYGFNTFLMTDTTRGITKEGIDKAQAEMEAAGVHMITAEEVPRPERHAPSTELQHMVEAVLDGVY
jgi:nicotinamidase/pyrazinamidase